MPNIVILDNDALFAQGLSFILESDPDNTILAITRSEEQLMMFLKQRAAETDLLTIDINLGKGFKNGLELAAEIRQQYNEIKILFLTGFKECKYLPPVFDEYEGYLFKDTEPITLRKAIKKITTSGKGSYYSQEVIQLYFNCDRNKRPDLSPEQIKTLKLIAQGYTDKQIADLLSTGDFSIGTDGAKERRRKLRYRLHAYNSAHLVAKAFKYGFVQVDDID